MRGALIEYKHMLDKYAPQLDAGTKTKADIARAVAARFNHDFGGVNYYRAGMSQTAQDVARLVLLGHDWTISNVLAATDAIRRGDVGVVHRALWMQVATKWLASSLILNLAMAGLSKDDPEDFFKQGWRDGKLHWMDVNITPIYQLFGGKSNDRVYWNMIGHFKDPLEWIHSWVSSVVDAKTPEQSIFKGIQPLRGKSSVVMSSLIDAALGQRYSGQTYTDLGELLKTGKLADYVSPWEKDKRAMGPIAPNQLPSYVLDQLIESLPGQLSSAIGLFSGQENALSALMALSGEKTSVKRDYHKKD